MALKQEREALLDHLCTRLAEFAAVPLANVEPFKMVCRVYILEAWWGCRLWEKTETAEIDELTHIMKDALRLRKRLARLEGASCTREFGDLLNSLLQPLADLAGEAKAAKRRRRGNHNKNRHAHRLIVKLEHLALSADGGFHFNHHDQEGSLIGAVTLLRKHFPDGFFPKVMTATEQRDLAEARRRPWRVVSYMFAERHVRLSAASHSGANLGGCTWELVQKTPVVPGTYQNLGPDS